MGYILLEEGAEFRGRIMEADKRALVLAGGVDSAVDIIPAYFPVYRGEGRWPEAPLRHMHTRF